VAVTFNTTPVALTGTPPRPPTWICRMPFWAIAPIAASLPSSVLPPDRVSTRRNGATCVNFDWPATAAWAVVGATSGAAAGTSATAAVARAAVSSPESRR
jgi:hypothetical protein